MLLNVNFYDIEGNIALERLNCKPLTDCSCQIKQIPLFLPNLALDDVVIFEKVDNEYFFEAFDSFSGNSTIQIVELADNGLARLLDEIKDRVGEIRWHKSGKYVAINVSPKQDYQPIQAVCIRYEQDNQISFKEACLGFIKCSEK